MIIRTSAIKNLWFRSALAWLIAVWLINVMTWPFWLEKEYDIDQLEWLWKVLPVIPVSLFFLGKFFPTSIRVCVFAINFGIGIAFPTLLVSLTPLALLIISLDLPYQKVWLILAHIFVGLLLFGQSFFFALKKIAISKYLENQLIPNGNKLCVSQDRSKDFCKISPMKRPILSNKWAGPVIFLSAICYPLQRYLAINFGPESILLVCSILLFPISVHVIKSFGENFALWVVAVRRIEISRNVKVVLTD
jgi:hypothetical protein